MLSSRKYGWELLCAGFLLLILYFRVTRGLDFTDEMQYYGEIRGLMETGKLFSNDLFIQQNVYIIFYPFLYGYHALFGLDGLVFFGRLLLALICIAVYVYASRKLFLFGCTRPVAAIAALSLTFSMPFHGVFALSYNTVSQALWIVYLIRFYEWRKHGVVLWAAIVLITMLAHPTAAVVMGALLVARMALERDLTRVWRFVLAGLIGSAILAIVLLMFAPVQQYLSALSFSSGYGVGSVFFHNRNGPVTLIAVLVMFALGYRQSLRPDGINVSLFLIGALVLALVLLSGGQIPGGYSGQLVLLLGAIGALGCAATCAVTGAATGIKRPPKSGATSFHTGWLVLAILLCMTNMGVTSGNGIGQATGALMICLPILLALSTRAGTYPDLSARPALGHLPLLLTLAIFVVHWCNFPYREVAWWRATEAIHDIPAFRFVNTSAQRNAVLQVLHTDLSPVTQNRKVLYVSDMPILYLTLAAQPETCMLFMHSLTSPKSQNALMDCMAHRFPDLVLDLYASETPSQDNLYIRGVMRTYYESRGFRCDDKILDFGGQPEVRPRQIKYRQCVI